VIGFVGFYEAPFNTHFILNEPFSNTYTNTIAGHYMRE